jgi:hypothetical protein
MWLAVSLALTDKMGPRVKPEDDSLFSFLRRGAALTRSPVIIVAGQSSHRPARRPAPQVDAPPTRWLAERVDGGNRGPGGPGGQAAAAESLKVPVPAGAERW